MLPHAHPSPLLCFVHEELGAPTRYRVRHHAEQARLAGMSATVVPLHAMGRRPDLRGCDLLYLHRLRLTTQTIPLILAARLRRIPVVYDSDDLVWDERIRQYEALDAYHPPKAVRQILAEVRRSRWLMALADALILSTPYLAERARERFHKPAYAHLNALSAEQVALADAALAARGPRRRGVTIGYFSGTRHAHDEDLASVAEALRVTLDARPDARLLLAGEVALPAQLAGPAYAGRVERLPKVDWRQLPALIAQVDVNIAPLIDNPQRRAKSAVKYLEAAAVRVTTVASRLDPYAGVIAEGVTGFLTGDGAEWTAALARLCADGALAASLGDAAHRQVLAEHTGAVRARAFRALVERVLADAERR